MINLIFSSLKFNNIHLNRSISSQLLPSCIAQVMWRSQPSERILVWRLMIEVNREISAESAFTTLTLSDLMLRMKYPPLEGAMGFTRNLNCTTGS